MSKQKELPNRKPTTRRNPWDNCTRAHLHNFPRLLKDLYILWFVWRLWFLVACVICVGLVFDCLLLVVLSDFDD